MLNILKLKKKHDKPAIVNDKGELASNAKHYPPANKEWVNSIYAYNKNTSKLLPVADKVILNLIKGYFSLYSNSLEKKVRSPRMRKWMRRLSTTRILISKAELKHTSDKVTVTLYIYNRQKKYYENKINKIFSYIGEKNITKWSKRIELLKIKGLQLISKVRQDKNMLLKTLKWNNNNFVNYEKDYFKNFISRSLKKEMLYMHFKQIMSLNKFKFKNTYLIPLKSLISKIYKKKVEFNLVTLKNFHLNSDIFTQILAIKLRKRDNRILRVLKTSLRKIRLPNLSKLVYLGHHQGNRDNDKILQNLIVKDMLLKNTYNHLALDHVKGREVSTDGLDNIIKLFFPVNAFSFFNKKEESANVKDESTLTLENSVLNSIKHKTLSGVRIEASGRLTRRITAARAVYKVKYLGNLRNLNATYLQRSSVILRGNLRSNIQFTKIKSKTRIGSFGLKGWVSSV